jgi:imidazolonepropionase-like amidohydrolase
MGNGGAPTGRCVYEAQHLFDGHGFVEPPRLAVVDGVVEAVGADVDGTADVILDGMTLMPGFVDCHQHLVFDGEGTLEEQVVGCSNDELAERARRQARRALEGGVTTLRDLGDRDFVTLPLRGDPDLPTILCSGPPITRPQGHCWYLNGECADLDDVMAAIAERDERGCDVVKIMATGGHMTPSTPPWVSQFDGDELSAVVEESHRRGLPVAAHCHGVQGISDAIDAGVDTIEHCSFANADPDAASPAALIERLATSQIAISATFGRCPDVPMPPPPEQLLVRMENAFRSMTRVRELGGRIVVGTDAGILPNKLHDVAPHAIEPLLMIGMFGRGAGRADLRRRRCARSAAQGTPHAGLGRRHDRRARRSRIRPVLRRGRRPRVAVRRSGALIRLRPAPSP